jgi:hypothetical protein
MIDLILMWAVGVATGLAIRIGRERIARLEGIAIGRREGRSQAYRR